MQSEMNVLVEESVMLEIEKAIVFVFMNSEVNRLAKKVIGGFEGDMKRILGEKSEIEKLVKEKELEIAGLKRRLDQVLIEIDEERGVSAHVSDERDEIIARLDVRVQEVNQLLLKVTELEKNEDRVLKEVDELKVECDRLKAEKTASERKIESVVKENDDLQSGLIVANGLVEELQRNIAKLDEEKKTIADEKIAQDGRNSELRGSVDELKKLIESMRIDEQTLLRKISDLEKKYAESLRNEVEMKIEVNGLVEEKKVTERRIEELVNEKTLITKDLEAAVNELEQRKLLYERIVQEKIETEDAKRQGESEIVKTREELHALKDKISSLEMTNVNQFEKLMELEDEVGSYKGLFDKASMEKDEAVNQLNNEKAITAELKQTVTGMGNEIEDLNKKVETLTTENEKHLGEKNVLEDRCAGLVKEVADLEVRFSESRMEFDGKLSAAEANSKRVLSILKRTVSGCDGDSDLDQENGVEDGIKEHVGRIEVIKRAFKDKESRLEEMKRQLELVESSVEEARREKSFWTMVSSTTTLLAAVVSLAYVVRAH